MLVRVWDLRTLIPIDFKLIHNFSRDNWATPKRGGRAVVICILLYLEIPLIDTYHEKIIMNMHKHLTLRMFTVVYRVICNCEKLEKTQKLNYRGLIK